MTPPEILCETCRRSFRVKVPATGFHVVALPHDPALGSRSRLKPICLAHESRKNLQVLPLDGWWRSYVVQEVMGS